MRRNQLLTALSLSIALAALPLIQFELYAAAVFSIFIGFFVALTEFSKHTRLLQIITLYFNTIVFGIALDQFTYGLPYFTAMFFAITLVITARIHLHKLLLFTRALWIEPLLLGGAIALYLLGNNHSVAGWLGWTVPVAPLLYASYTLVGTIITGVKFRKAEKHSYAAGLGSTAPTFMLTDHEGNLINSSQYKGRKHLIVVFLRGDWCPTSHTILRAYQRNLKKFRQKDITLVAISPDPAAVNREMVEKLGIEFSIVADEDQEVAKTFGVQLQDNNYAAKYAEGIPMPASFLVDKNGMVLYSSRSNRIGEVISPADIFPIVETMPQAI